MIKRFWFRHSVRPLMLIVGQGTRFRETEANNLDVWFD